MTSTTESSSTSSRSKGFGFEAIVARIRKCRTDDSRFALQPGRPLATNEHHARCQEPHRVKQGLFLEHPRFGDRDKTCRCYLSHLLSPRRPCVRSAAPFTIDRSRATGRSRTRAFSTSANCAVDPGGSCEHLSSRWGHFVMAMLRISRTLVARWPRARILEALTRPARYLGRPGP